MTKNEECESIIQQLQNLETSHEQEINQAIEWHTRDMQRTLNGIRDSFEIASSQTTSGNKSKAVVRETQRSRPNNNHHDKWGQPLAIGDIVKLLTSAGAGNEGDIAKIDSFWNTSAIVILNEEGTIAKTTSKNLQFIDE